MLFNSAVFVVFFLLVYTVYLLLRRRYRAQNILLLVASYVFYGWFDWRFVSLLAIVTIVNFFAGKRIYRSENPLERKLFLALAVITSLSILGFFKYFGFFAENVVRVLNSLGFQVDYVTLNILLPIGLSFFILQAVGYTIDTYRRNLAPTKRFLDFALFVSFFPQLLAGPIERAANLLPQIKSPRKISAGQVDSGISLILWGLFKKMVIADNLGMLIADPIFGSYTEYQGIDILVGVLAFTVQIYCDFSGYTDIARGVAKLMGFDLMLNFKLPYFARNPRDFWSRWHISLSSWFRDYVYISLGGNRKGKLTTYRNLNVTMLLAGLWHGAAWNFVLWGAYHGVLLSVYRILGKDKEDANSPVGAHSFLKIFAQVLLMFIFTVIGWTIFRSTSVDQILYMFTHVGFSISNNTPSLAYNLLFFSVPLYIMQILQYFSRDLLIVTKLRPWVRVPIYSFLVIGILVFGVRESVDFIYFQF